MGFPFSRRCLKLSCTKVLVFLFTLLLLFGLSGYLQGSTPNYQFQNPNFRLRKHETGSSLLPGMILTDEDATTFQENEKHSFNVFLSDALPLDRKLPDFRDDACPKEYRDGETFPKASVIICFHNEAISVLLRTVVSVISRTPADLLQEIILVDDASDIQGLKDNSFQTRLSQVSAKISLKRLPSREGLIRARITGAQAAIGPVLVFMDSHCEVTEGWLEPLLGEIAADSSTVVCPVIDLINPDNFRYSASPRVRGGFNWGLHFRWEPIPEDEHSKNSAQPFRTPAMAGGLFAIDKKYFHHIGEYDDGMEIWGGENIEISLRIWLCGGQLKIVPCSRVGHIFRDKRPYSSSGKGDTHLQNSLRLAHLWMDSYIERYFQARPEARDLSFGDLTKRISLKQSLKCKSFQWYLNNVYPEALDESWSMRRVPQRIAFTAKFSLQHLSTGKCVENGKFLQKGNQVKTSECSKLLLYGTSDESSAVVLNKRLCLDASQTPNVVANKCSYSGGFQAWEYNLSSNWTWIWNAATGMCLGLDKMILKMTRCNVESNIVSWKFLPV